MGEELQGGSVADVEDAQAASNAMGSEGDSPAPELDAGGDAAPDAGSAAPEGTGATQALTGDENDDQIAEHFQKLLGTPMTEGRVKQLTRLSKANRDYRRTQEELDQTRTTASKMTPIMASIEKAKANCIARNPVYREIFDRLAGDELATVAFMSDPDFRDKRIDDLLGPKEVPGLDVSDPVHAMLAKLQAQVDGIDQERAAAKEASQQEADVAAYDKETNDVLDSLGVKGDSTREHANYLLTGLYAKAVMAKPGISLKELAPELTKLMGAVAAADTSEAEKQTDEAKPVVPRTAKAPPTEGDDDEAKSPEELVDDEAFKNAMRP